MRSLKVFVQGNLHLRDDTEIKTAKSLRTMCVAHTMCFLSRAIPAFFFVACAVHFFFPNWLARRFLLKGFSRPCFTCIISASRRLKTQEVSAARTVAIGTGNSKLFSLENSNYNKMDGYPQLEFCAVTSLPPLSDVRWLPQFPN